MQQTQSSHKCYRKCHPKSTHVTYSPFNALKYNKDVSGCPQIAENYNLS